MFRLFAHLATRAPIAIIAVFLAACAAMAPGLTRAYIDVNLRNLLDPNDPLVTSYDKLLADFGSDRVMFAITAVDDAYSPETITTLRRLTENAANLPGVTRTISLVNIDAIRADSDSIEIAPLVRESIEDLATPTVRSALRKTAEDNPLVINNIVGKDEKTVAVGIYLEIKGGDERPLMSAVRASKTLFNEDPAKLNWRFVGSPPLSEAIFTEVRRDLQVLSVVPVLLIALLLVALFRSFRGVFLPLITVGISVEIAFGMLGYAGQPIDGVTSMLPALIAVIGITDVIHVLTHYIEVSQHDNDKLSAIARTIRGIGPACFVTSLTTAVGFGSLAFAEMPPVRTFGWLAAIGIMVAFLVSLLFVPAVLSLMPPPPARLVAVNEGGFLRRLLDRIAHFVERRPRAIAAATIVAYLIAGAAIPHLRIESALRQFLPLGHPIIEAFTFAETQLGGVSPMSIRIDTPDEATMLSPEVMNAIDAATREIAADPLVASHASFVTYLAMIRRAVFDGNPAEYRVPISREEASQFLLLAEGSRQLDSYLTPSRTSAHISLRFLDPNTRTINRLVARAKSACDKHFGPLAQRGVVATVTGAAALSSGVAGRLVEAQLNSLFSALIPIVLMMIILFRSVVIGLYSVIPNALPIALTMGLMVAFDIPINVVTVMVAPIALGIAVDDTIHYITRYLAELRATGDRRQAMFNTFHSIGRAIVFTSFVIGGGFASVSLAHIRPQAQFGALTASAMVLALLADLLIMPAILRYLPYKMPRPVEDLDAEG